MPEIPVMSRYRSPRSPSFRCKRACPLAAQHARIDTASAIRRRPDAKRALSNTFPRPRRAAAQEEKIEVVALVVEERAVPAVEVVKSKVAIVEPAKPQSPVAAFLGKREVRQGMSAAVALLTVCVALSGGKQ